MGKRHHERRLCVRWPIAGFLFVAAYLAYNRLALGSKTAFDDHGDGSPPPLAALAKGDGGESPYAAHMRAVLKGCKDICRVDMEGTPSLYFDYIEKEVDCHALLTNAAIDAAMAEPDPPRELPPEMVDAFTYGGRFEVLPFSGEPLNQRYMGSTALTSNWTKELVDNWKAQCKAGTLEGSYSVDDTRQVVEALGQMDLEGASVLVIGSERPWVEACALSAGAAHVTTVEYGAIESSHPQVTALTPAQVRASPHEFMARFDAVITYSSVEHSGLGRYGDALNPWGDRQVVARAWCMTKAGGRLALGVPHTAQDRIMYNAHREYGPVQLPHLFANWKQLWQTDRGLYHRVWVCGK